MATPGTVASPSGADAGSVRVEREAEVATVVLDRPHKRNAMSYAMWCDLQRACASVDDDATVRVVVLRGVGEHFCTGADITELVAERAADEPSFHDVNMAAERALADLARPTVAAVRGDCIGGGAALAIDCDLRVAARTARFGITPSRLGVVYPAPSLERVLRLLGPAAKRLLFSGELIDAEEAWRIGLVDAVVDDVRLDDTVAEWCSTLASRSLLSQVATKQMIAAVWRDGAVPDALAARWRDMAAATGETAEGVAAFGARRPPRFPWRGA